MRTRMFLRTSEFLWQEGHTAHASREEVMDETLKMLEVYRSFSAYALAMPVIAGEKPENERFPGAEGTYANEGIKKDGTAMQAETHPCLAPTFITAQHIRHPIHEGRLT